MQCPKCKKDLVGVDYLGVHIETCPACGGDWLDAGQLQSILHARQTRFTREECIAVAQAAKIHGTKLVNLNRHLACPQCGNQTNPINYGDDSGLIIDKCPSCGGIWMEKDELDKIEELVQGWDDELPDDLSKYGPKLRQTASDEDVNQTVHISHVHFINSMINGILDLMGE
jgi:uncharacterized protein